MRRSALLCIRHLVAPLPLLSPRVSLAFRRYIGARSWPSKRDVCSAATYLAVGAAAQLAPLISPLARLHSCAFRSLPLPAAPLLPSRLFPRQCCRLVAFRVTLCLCLRCCLFERVTRMGRGHLPEGRRCSPDSITPLCLAMLLHSILPLHASLPRTAASPLRWALTIVISFCRAGDATSSPPTAGGQVRPRPFEAKAPVARGCRPWCWCSRDRFIVHPDREYLIKMTARWI